MFIYIFMSLLFFFLGGHFYILPVYIFETIQRISIFLHETFSFMVILKYEEKLL